MRRLLWALTLGWVAAGTAVLWCWALTDMTSHVAVAWVVTFTVTGMALVLGWGCHLDDGTDSYELSWPQSDGLARAWSYHPERLPDELPDLGIEPWESDT